MNRLAHQNRDALSRWTKCFHFTASDNRAASRAQPEKVTALGMAISWPFGILTFVWLPAAVLPDHLPPMFPDQCSWWEVSWISLYLRCNSSRGRTPLPRASS
jgi:hypothetical protein